MKFRIYFALIMSCVLSFLMSGWITYVNLGLHPDFVFFWMTAWRFAWPAAAVISFVFAPEIQRLSGWLAKKL
ncbi:DUF2798 domain-containing protein [Marinomonas posidonica]|uniref:DUF2798 domain-containing protein n=1 Tax=Marinomonas posidonica (strain CECT 7376 / NCIMB 14433 / IVIA-Po-181) TaxID=491952 RepID=F6CYZ8_MARPP|nr:DUF2798 domain-containing protein [Marinomonas posidonica]AEF53125.1 hypothetical protein Mar181_0056 [Marinomonas posidonica IVIA-Po-181]